MEVTYKGIFSYGRTFFFKAFNRVVSFFNSGLRLIILSGLQGIFQYEITRNNNDIFLPRAEKSPLRKLGFGAEDYLPESCFFCLGKYPHNVWTGMRRKINNVIMMKKISQLC